MTIRTLTVDDLASSEDMAAQVSGFWDVHQTQRLNQVYQWDELRQYIYATDTDSSSGVNNDWKNRTVRPKLTWIYDKMLTSYIQKLMPNDQFFRWKSSGKDENKETARVIEHFMRHKIKNKHVNFREIVASSVSDWLLTGNAFGGAEYIEKKQRSLAKDGEEIVVFRGARPIRYNPIDVNLDASASTWEDSFCITRELIRKEAFFSYVEDNPNAFLPEGVDIIRAGHNKAYNNDIVEYIKQKNRTIDGTTIYDSWAAGITEVLHYHGAMWDPITNTYKSNMHVIVGDRIALLYKGENPSYLYDKPVVFSSFRKRPDNLWGMGPLENLVGMQYRIDHEENLKSDALDACAYPIVKVTGDSGEQDYQVRPGETWYVPPGGDVELVYPDPRVGMFESDISIREQAMEEFASMPRETAGFRTPGEKTKYEVASLLNSAGEHPDEKLAQFESQYLEPLLNLMLELNIRNLSQTDLESIPAGDLEIWNNIKVEDLKVDGRLYPVGIKHSKEAGEKIQKTMAIIETASQIAPEHFNKFKAMKVLEEEMALDEEKLISFGAGMKEQKQLQKVQETLEKEEMRKDPNAVTR